MVADSAGGPFAVLLDMDGTLVDTEPAWMAAETAMAEAHGASWSHEQALELVGSALPDAAEAWRRGTGVDLSTEHVVDTWLEHVVAGVRDEVPWRPGARDLLADLRRHGVPTALVTMSWRSLADAVLAAVPPDTFDAVVTGDVVDRGKPHPEPYLRAAGLLGVPPERCVAIEDSATGAASAEAAGCLVVVVPHHVRVPVGEDRVELPGLEGVGTADLQRLLSDRRPAAPRSPR